MTTGRDYLTCLGCTDEAACKGDPNAIYEDVRAITVAPQAARIPRHATTIPMSFRTMGRVNTFLCRLHR